VAAVEELFKGYLAWLGEDLAFQGTQQEFADFPAGYDILLLARCERDLAVGAVGLKPRTDEAPGADPSQRVCEMKRLFVVPDHWGFGLGRALSEALIEEARGFGYARMVLDSLERLHHARAVYERLGFTRRLPYYNNPLPGVVYMEKAL